MSDKKTQKEVLTDEQVKNWRKAMVNLLGPYALVMPREEVERLRDRLQARLDGEAKEAGR